jgi:hypothetical protein
MLVMSLSPVETVVAQLERQLDVWTQKEPAWVLMYAVEDVPLAAMIHGIRRRYPAVPVFGATSFRGIFTPDGFIRGAGLMMGERGEPARVAVSLHATGASNARNKAQGACHHIQRELGRMPDVLLLHATPGFEERILEGITSVFGRNVPVFGGSAADDAIAGRWRVFANDTILSEGFLLVGIISEPAPSGSFVGGYLPTEHTGTITRVTGRIVEQIDGRPAALVYDEWTGGAIRDKLGGGNVLLQTSLLPVARTVGKAVGMPRRLLSHPHEVHARTQALAFFTEFAARDQITLMTGTRDPLITRVRRAVARARTPKSDVRAGLLVFCAGCLGNLLDSAGRIAQEFGSELRAAPFIGIATFGEQGSFFQNSESLHGNLMCSAVLL